METINEKIKTFLGTLYGERLLIETKDKMILELIEDFLKDATDCPRCKEEKRDYVVKVIGLEKANKIYYPKL